MQNLALLFLLAIMASTIFAFDASVLAQEAPEDEITDEEVPEETDDGVMEDDAMEDDTIEDDATMEDEVEATLTQDVDSPRQQLMSGTDPHEIQCDTGLKLVFKASNFHPACVKESSYQVLLQRGWVSDHDPSHEELTAMMEKLPKVEETEDIEQDIEIEEELSIEEDTSAGNSTEPASQDHAVELSESMSMGAN